jgi:ABC-type bacteriocin/lantibiotic exporter with double-glycine peptidase domain
MVEACLTCRAGTTEFGEYRGFLEKGVKARVVEWPAEAFLREGCVAVVRVKGRHVVCVRGMGSGVVVHDPLLGEPGYWDEREFRERYAGVGVVVKGSGGGSDR